MKKADAFMEVGGTFTEMLERKSPDEIAAEVSYMNLVEHVSFVAEIFNRLGIDLSGTGMEVGAGASVLSNSLARLFPSIKKIHALEIVPFMVTKLQPKIIEATNMQGRVMPLVGDFNNIKFPDNSLDFVVEFDALHHSNDLHKTLAEIGRVLKRGGKLICFDRAHPDHMPIAQEQFLLNTEYSADYKKQHGLNPAAPYKRRDNGEHEPRIRDWERALSDTDLKLDAINIFTKRNLRDFIKIKVAHIPYFIRSFFNKAKNLTAHSKLILYYLCPSLARYGKIKIFPLNTDFKTPSAPMRKMVLVFSKI